VLEKMGLHEWVTAWLADPHWAMPCLIAVTIWSGTGFNAILFSARLSGIDEEIFAAAELDGAGHWQRIWRIAFPIAADYFGVVTMLQYLWNLFGSAGLLLILTRGGPGEATSTLSWLVYHFGFQEPFVARLSGQEVLAVTAPPPLAALAVLTGETVTLAVANQGPDPVRFRLPDGTAAELGGFPPAWFDRPVSASPPAGTTPPAAPGR
jgi:ABC-type Fe3+ transport system permease subunit